MRHHKPVTLRASLSIAATRADRYDDAHTRTAEAHTSAAGIGTRHWLGQIIRSMATCIAAWHRRSRQRQELRELPAHLLKDIGVSREQAWREASKPFWLK